MKLPRDIDGPQLVKALRVLGYEVTRQKGSHIRITIMLDGEHHEAVPAHSPIKTGTLGGILKGICRSPPALRCRTLVSDRYLEHF